MYSMGEADREVHLWEYLDPGLKRAAGRIARCLFGNSAKLLDVKFINSTFVHRLCRDHQYSALTESRAVAN